MKTLVVADDITGANDIAVMYAKSGLKTVTYTCGTRRLFQTGESVCVADTDSRFLEPEEAYRRVYDAVKLAPDCDRYFDKQCSVFRGNIGAEFDAMLDALEEDFAVVVPGYPENGRTTINSIHYVHGVELAQSQFRNDPVHPMKESDMCRILASQTRRRVGAITVEDLDKGAEHLKKALEQARQTYQYVIFDTRDEKDLALIARVIAREKVVCGSAQIGYYLGLQEQMERHEPVLAMAGSLTPQTIAQVAYLRRQGFPVIELDTVAVAEGADVLEDLLSRAEAGFDRQDLVLIHTTQEPEKVGETKEKALARGISNVEISGNISSIMARAARELCRRRGIRKCIVLGGDTSAAFCRAMEITGMEIGQEIEPGVPLLKKTGEDFHFVLKSGSFGSEAFIEKAYCKLLPF